MGSCWGHVGPMLGHLGPILGLCWAILGLCGAILGPSGAYVGPSWGPSWLILWLCWGTGYPDFFFRFMLFLSKSKKHRKLRGFSGAEHRSAAGARSPIAKASGLRPGALPVHRACWPDFLRPQPLYQHCVKCRTENLQFWPWQSQCARLAET